MSRSRAPRRRRCGALIARNPAEAAADEEAGKGDGAIFRFTIVRIGISPTLCG
jgi:hypothetical protein